MAEAIGFALAIAPLIVSATEHYSSVVKIIKRFCKYEAGQQDLISLVNIQRTIFRKTLERLLAFDVGVGEELASEMLKDAEHPTWRDEEVESYFQERMADSSEALKDAIRLINTHLISLKADQASSEFGSVIQSNKSPVRHCTVSGNGILPAQQSIEPLQPKSREDRSQSSLGKKLRFAFSKEDMREAVENIRRLTKDFCTLIKQTAPPHARNALSNPTWSTQKKVAKFARVKTAAGNLYEALGLACTKHIAHHAHLSLQPKYGDSSQIRFTIAFRQTTLQIPDNSTFCDPADANHFMWLTVESSISSTTQGVHTSDLVEEVRSSLKRRAEPDKTPRPYTKPKKLVKKCVTFRASATPSVPLPLTLTMPNATEPPIQNLCTHRNFCNQLQKLLSRPLEVSDTCVGYLECSKASKHLIYIKSKQQCVTTSPSDPHLKPLREVYSAIKHANNPGTNLSLHERVGLARQLTTAVLQFHTTPWLPNSICSDDVLLQDIEDPSRATDLVPREPYVNVSIKGPHGPLTKRLTTPSKTLIRNRLLFSLGVMLLELAYQAPLNSLQKPADIDNHEPQNTDYYTADRVRHEAASILGPRYAEVARKCIQCDFGHGDDLSYTKLQEGFYQDAICELEELEERFRSFGLGI